MGDLLFSIESTHRISELSLKPSSESKRMKIANFKCGRKGSLMKVHSLAAKRKEGLSPIEPGQWWAKWKPRHGNTRKIGVFLEITRNWIPRLSVKTKQNKKPEVSTLRNYWLRETDEIVSLDWSYHLPKQSSWLQFVLGFLRREKTGLSATWMDGNFPNCKLIQEKSSTDSCSQFPGIVSESKKEDTVCRERLRGEDRSGALLWTSWVNWRPLKTLKNISSKDPADWLTRTSESWEIKCSQEPNDHDFRPI